jgi:NADPH:quinone reductase-like Zn-dependent oxidoreductase
VRSYHLETPGRPEGIVLRVEDDPLPGPTGILVRVHAAALNRRDLLILQRRYSLPAMPDVVPVSDGAGEVVAVGDAVTRFRVGDRVLGSYWPRWHDGRLRPELVDQLGCTLDGMLREYAVLDEQWAVPAPGDLSWVEAATLPCAGVTAWTSLFGEQPVRPGQTVLVLGTGGVSLFALQLARAAGCQVVATTSSGAKVARLLALGADHVVDVTECPDWGPRVRELTGGQGVDRVVETGGPDTIEQSMRAAARYAQIVLLITASARRSGIEIPNAAYASSLATIRRVFVGSRADLEALAGAVARLRLRPVVDRVFDFADAREAFRYYLRGEVFGKVVVRVS